MMSCTIRIGNRIAAACRGGITSAIIGVEAMPTPANPPFDRPSSVTAGIMASQKSGSVSTESSRGGCGQTELDQSRGRRLMPAIFGYGGNVLVAQLALAPGPL